MTISERSAHAPWEVAPWCLKAETSSLISWLRSMQEQPNNPFGVEIGQFGAATALLTRSMPGGAFNRVMGLSWHENHLIEDILQFYQAHGVQCHFDLSPYHTDPRLLARLAHLGFYQSAFQMLLSCFPTPEQPPSPVDIRTIEPGPNDREVCIDIWNQGFGAGADCLAGLWEQPEWRLYLALVDGLPASVALLHIQDGLAWLAGATTIERLEGRGCQSALIHRRLTDAAKAGCRLVAVQTAANVPSFRNMQRAGFTVAYSKVWWSPLPQTRP